MEPADLLLVTAALVFLGVAATGPFLPRRILEPLGGSLTTPSVANEMRANYGGMHLGIAVLLFLGVRDANLRVPALALLLTICSGLCLGRVVSWIVDGRPNRYLLFFFALEAIGALAAAAALRPALALTTPAAGRASGVPISGPVAIQRGEPADDSGSAGSGPRSLTAAPAANPGSTWAAAPTGAVASTRPGDPRSASVAGGNPRARRHDPDEPEPIFPASTDGIREAMGYKRYDLVECYDAWAKIDPKLAGTVRVHFVLTTGKGDRAEIEDVGLLASDLQHTVLEGCILSVIGSMQFGNPEDGRLAVTYPLHFAQDAPAQPKAADQPE